MKVRIVIGDRDEDCLEGAMKLDSLLRDLGVEHEMRVIEGMDHDYPDDLCDDIAAALRK
jgi:esterase/lipase superfamily enzyme